MTLLKTCVMVLVCCGLLMGTCWAAAGTRTIVDSRGVEVQIPAEIERVVTVSDGLIEEVMFILGVEDKIVGLGSSPCGVRVGGYNSSIPTVNGKTYEYLGGMEPVTCLSPSILDLPRVKESSSGINYEALSGLDPDLVILRVGDCTLSSMEDEGVQKTIQLIEALNIPVVVLKAHTCFDEPNRSTFSDEIRIMGNVFGKEEKAGELADYLESLMKNVSERTEDIPEAERPNIIVFAASPASRKAGGAGMVRGTDTIDSYFIEAIVHAKNAYRNSGTPIVSAEQLLALDPDIIILTAWMGYHPPEELYSAPYYQNVGELRAVKNRRVYALPFTAGCNCAKRLEYPIHVMVIAKAAYPERFDDIDLSEWLLEFYQNVYGIDRATAEGLRSAQFMDWCVEGWTPTLKSST